MLKATFGLRTHRSSGHNWRLVTMHAALMSLALLLGACSALPEWLQETVAPGSAASDDGAAGSTAEAKPKSATGPPAAAEPADGLAYQTAPQNAVATETRTTPAAAESVAGDLSVADQTAAVPPTAAVSVVTRILFPEGSVELSEVAKDQLLLVATALEQDDSARVQLLAFAQGAGGGARRARRLSLTRAFVVRGVLIDLGVLSDRVSLRSFGSKIQDGPPDRVDVLLQERG